MFLSTSGIKQEYFLGKSILKHVLCVFAASRAPPPVTGGNTLRRESVKSLLIRPDVFNDQPHL